MIMGLSFTPSANPAMAISCDCCSACKSHPEALQSAPQKAGDTVAVQVPRALYFFPLSKISFNGADLS